MPIRPANIRKRQVEAAPEAGPTHATYEAAALKQQAMPDPEDRVDGTEIATIHRATARSVLAPFSHSVIECQTGLTRMFEGALIRS